MLGVVWKERGYPDRAAQSIDEAIRLAPHEPDFYAFRGLLWFEKSKWNEALASAETGLTFDAEHADCNNLRAMALVKLGRKAEATATIDSSLARDPENSWTHANMGWTLLDQRNPKQAAIHFREALRLEATNDYARAGLVEALKARNPIYGLFLRYILWMAKLPPKWQIGVVIGGVVGNNLLRGAAEDNPELAPWIEPITTAYIIFVLFTWLAVPIFNLLLRAHPLGKHALSDEQRSETNWIGGVLLAAAVFFLASSLGGWWLLLESTAIQWAVLALPIHIVFCCRADRSRRVMIGVTAALFALSLLFLAMPLFTRNPSAFSAVSKLFWYGFIAAIWGGQALAAVRPRF
jgi:tetratricopeptide (TPR) repeat protein